jgi:hypothetical protein
MADQDQPEPLMRVVEEAPKLYSQAQLEAAIADAVDRDRIAGFMVFARNLPDQGVSMVYGTNLQARAIMRALAKTGY